MLIKKLNIIILILFIGCSTGSDETAPVDSSDLIPYSENKRYWQYKNEPILLIGGSIRDNLFQLPDVKQQLDILASAGGNYVRNNMTYHNGTDVWEFQKLENGKFDLEKLNEEYFQRLDNLLELAQERDIIVQIELWNRFDYAQEQWFTNPYRPDNNINYTSEEIGLKNEYLKHPGQNENPFFRSVPEQDNNQELLKYQEKRVNRILDISLQYPNVLYTMDNETSATPDWSAYWIRFIKDRAAEEGTEVQTTEMWDARNLRDDQHKHTFNNPELYDYADISQNNHNTDQDHWDNLQWAGNYTSNEARPLNNVKIYGSDMDSRYGTQQDAVERFWRNIMGGSAAVRFHRPPLGMGLTSVAQTNISSASNFISRFDIFNARPDPNSELLANRLTDEAYLSYIPGQEYAIYFTNGGDIELDLRNQTGTYSLIWLHIDEESWSSPQDVEGGQFVKLSPSEEGQWIALLEKK